MEILDNIGKGILDIYNLAMSMLPPFLQNFINLFLIVLLIVIYSIFIWKFYEFIAKKNILGLNLSKYNRSNHPLFEKLFAGGLYFAEYILILPFLIFFWFSIFTIFLIFLTENLPVSTLLIISVTIIGAIRMISYIPDYGQNLSKEIAKLLPFTLLAVSITKPGFFDIQRILGQILELSSFFNQIIIYLAFIIILEVILRFFDFIFSLFDLNDIPEIKEKYEGETEDEE